MTARDVKRSALGMGRILLGVIMALVGPMWLVSALVDYTRPTVPTNNLVAPSVEVHDETGSFEPIDGRPLTDALGDVKFTRPIHLVILSTDDLVDDNLDEATLKYARARHQEWISPNGYKWADGYLILSLSPTHRKVGTYFGEDIAPLLFVQEEIQDAAKDDFRAGRWSQGMVAAATKAAAYIPNEAGYSIKNRVVWPHWTGWLVSLTGIGVLLRGHSLRRTVRESSERIAEAWEETEERRSEVERAFHSIVDAGHYSKGLTARYGCAHQERKKVRERVAVLKSPGFFGSLSAGVASEREELLEDIELLSAADDAIFASRDFFALAPRWRDLWDNEVGPVFEDLSAADSISVKVRNRVKKHQVKNAVEAFNRWTNEQRDIIVGLGVSLEYADITPVQALNELDRIADESRARLTTLIGQALVADTSSSFCPSSGYRATEGYSCQGGGMTSQATETMSHAPQHPRSIMRSVRGCARLEAARAERENLRARIAAAASIPFVASLSGATAWEAEMIVEDFHVLMDAHVAMMAACDLFALTPTWRTVWENELGPVYEDLTVIETITETVQSRSMAPMVLSMAASLVLWLDEQRLALNDLGTSLERAQIDSAEALTQLDRIADEARVHLVHLVEAVLGADTSMIGQRRYKRWRKGAGEKLRTNETRYLGAYRIADVTYTYNTAQAIRLTANSAGIDLKGSAAHSTARFTAFGAELYVPPAYLHRYLVWDGTSRYGSSRANYLTSAANVGPRGRTR